MNLEKKVKRVAVFPAGSEIGLEIHEALQYSTFFELVGFSSVPCHASYVYKEYYEGLPFYTSPDFLEILNDWIRRYEIDFLYPAYDDIQLYLTLHQAEIACTVVTSEENTVHICRSKKRTYEYFKGEMFVPKTYEVTDAKIPFPVFIKPDIGQGSQGAKLIHTQEELEYTAKNSKELVICEYLPGEEFTIDCFSDGEGKLLSCNMRNRKRIRNGISVSSEWLELPQQVRVIAETIHGRLHFTGAWFFQVKLTNQGEYKLLEAAPRIAGTMGLTRHLGINYPMLTLFVLSGKSVSVTPNEYEIAVDRALFSRYRVGITYDIVYVDLDDTLIVRNQVNTMLVKFLYQCVNQNKKLILLTKHARNVAETLAAHKISEHLFDEIIHIGQEDSKWEHIHENAVFIDDSFAERKSVKEHCGIPVFDCSEIEALLDWKEV